jgi:hypothetical protein
MRRLWSLWHLGSSPMILTLSSSLRTMTLIWPTKLLPSFFLKVCSYSHDQGCWNWVELFLEYILSCDLSGLVRLNMAPCYASNQLNCLVHRLPCASCQLNCLVHRFPCALPDSHCLMHRFPCASPHWVAICIAWTRLLYASPSNASSYAHIQPSYAHDWSVASYAQTPFFIDSNVHTTFVLARMNKNFRRSRMHTLFGKDSSSAGSRYWMHKAAWIESMHTSKECMHTCNYRMHKPRWIQLVHTALMHKNMSFLHSHIPAESAGSAKRQYMRYLDQRVTLKRDISDEL